MVVFEDAVLGAGLVLLGFFFNALWERSKAKRLEVAERQRTVLAIWMEFEDNATTCRQLIGAIDRGGLKGFATLPPLKAQAWSLASSNWPLLRFDRETGRLLSNLVALTEGINATIRAREFYGATMLAMSNYEQTVEAINKSLRGKFELSVKDYEKLRAALEAYQAKEGLQILISPIAKGS